MRKALKMITACFSVLAVCITLLYVFGDGLLHMDTSRLTALARSIDLGAVQQDAETETVIEVEPQAPPENYLLPYPQTPSMFSDMDMQYAYLILQQGLDRSFLSGNAVLSLENGKEFVISAWSKGSGYDITEGLADNETRLAEWENALNTLWELDAVLSRDIKETLGTDKSVTIQIVDENNKDAVLLKIKDGCIEYNLFRDGTSPDYEVYRGY